MARIDVDDVEGCAIQWDILVGLRSYTEQID